MISSIFYKKKKGQDDSQFRLAKFFAYTGFIVLILATFPFSVVISQKTKDILIESYENYALLVGENLNHQVFANFVVPAYQYYGSIALREKEQAEWLDRIVKNTIHGFNIDSVSIYSVENPVIAYSTDPGLLGTEMEPSEGYLRALEGSNTSHVMEVHESSEALKFKFFDRERKLQTFIPFQNMDPMTGEKGFIGGVFEIIQDLTKEYNSIVKLQFVIFGLSVFFMVLIFLVLLLLVHKAERILEQRTKRQIELKTQLEHKERLASLGEMIAGVSHEIRNPLGIIRSTAELLGNTSSGNISKKLTDVIVEESSRLNNIVTEFLDFARPKKPNFEQCMLGDIILKNLTVFDPQFKKGNIKVNHNIEAGAFPIFADSNLLYRCFVNIFSNAVQAMSGRTGGGITITVKKQNVIEGYNVYIEDTGAGIAEDKLLKIFNPFFSTKDEGSGLGLAIVKNIVEGHCGSVHIASRENYGTTVTVFLPVKPDLAEDRL